MSIDRNIFISHVHSDDEHVAKMKELLSTHGYDVRDSSITTDKPNEAQSESYIKSEILAPRIKWASTVVVLISPETSASDYVNWETTYGEKQGKRIVGVWIHGDKDCEVPQAAKDYADAIVGWDGERIIDAIEGRIDNWENPDGSSMSPTDLKRHNC